MRAPYLGSLTTIRMAVSHDALVDTSYKSSIKYEWKFTCKKKNLKHHEWRDEREDGMEGERKGEEGRKEWGK